MATRVCAKCGSEKPEGWKRWLCRPCYNTHNREYNKVTRHSRKETISNAKKRYWDKHKERYSESRKQYRAGNVEKMKAYLKEYNKKNYNKNYARKQELLKDGRRNLAKWYVAFMLKSAGFTDQQIAETPELIIIKTAQVKIQRYVKNQKSA